MQLDRPVNKLAKLRRCVSQVNFGSKKFGISELLPWKKVGKKWEKTRKKSENKSENKSEKKSGK